MVPGWPQKALRTRGLSASEVPFGQNAAQARPKRLILRSRTQVSSSLYHLKFDFPWQHGAKTEAKSLAK